MSTLNSVKFSGTWKENAMIKVSPGREGNIIVLRAVGKLTDQDYKDVLIPRDPDNKLSDPDYPFRRKRC